MDPYATHLPHTVRMALRAIKLYPMLPLLELGCGDYSTPILRAIADSTGHVLDVRCTDAVWGAKHEATVIPDWSTWRPTKQYSFCLMDNELTSGLRFDMLRMLASYVHIVVFHDAIAAQRMGRDWNTLKSWYDPIDIYPDTANGTAVLVVR